MTAGENDDDVAHGRVAIAVAQVSGPARYLLLREGVRRHTLAQCSGIATASRDLLDASHAGGFEGIEAGTRKATPSIRLVEKYGMLFGGVDAHRYDLSSMLMLKDHHVWSTGSITSAVTTAHQTAGFSIRADDEVQSYREAR